MNKTASLAKISRPVFKTVLMRERLFSRLDVLRDVPVLWISGPPGSGKTTLVSSYIESRGMQSLWYQVDHGDKEAATFFYYLGLAAYKVSPRRKKKLPSLVPESLQHLNVFTRRFFQGLYSRLKAPSVLVFDNYQDALNDKTFNAIVRDGLSEIPEGVKVIVISHNDPPPTFSRMRAYQQMKLITWDDLRLTLDESRELAHKRGGTKLSEEIIQDLQNKTHGWAAGLVLLLERMKIEGLSIESTSLATSELIFDYFVAEIFEKLDVEIRDFLLKTSLLPSTTAHIAKELTSNNNASSILSDMAQKNCFTLRHVHNKRVHYQFHYLFRQFLLAKVEEELDHETLMKVKAKAARVLLEDGQKEAATRLLMECEDWDTLVSLIIKEAPRLIKYDMDDTLERWIKGIPEGIFKVTPWLGYWLGNCRLPFNPAESLTHFENAFDEFRASDDFVGMVRAICGILNSISVEYKDYSQSDRWIDTFSKLLKTHPQALSRNLEDHATSSFFYIMALRQPDHPDFDLWKERAHRIIEGKGEPDLRMLVGNHLVIHYCWSERLASAAMVLDTLQMIPLPEEISPLVKARKISAEQLYYLFADLYEECLKARKEGLELARSSGVHIWESQYHLAAALLAVSYGDLQWVEELFSQIVKCFREMEYVNNLHLSYYYFVMGFHSLAIGDIQFSVVNFEKGLHHANVGGTTMPELVNLTGMAQALHAIGDERGARQYLDKTRKLGHRMKSSIAEFTCLVLDAQISLDMGEDEVGLKALGRAFALGARQRHTNFLGWLPSSMASLAARAMKEGIEVGYVRELVRKRALFPETPPLDVNEWPWAVKIFSLGRFEVLIDDKPLTFLRKAPKKPIEMLKALVAFGVSDVSEVRISDVLWPDAEGDNAHTAFTTTLRRLRKLIGVDDAIELVEGKLSLNRRLCWVDITAVGELLEKARSAGHERRAGFIEKAAGLYRATPLMAGDDAGPRALTLGEQLKSSLLKSLKDAARDLEKRGDYEEAARLYELGIEVDVFSEGFYCSLMSCYKNLGRMAEAIDVYNRLKKILSVNFGIEPSKKTSALNATLLREY